MENKKFLTQYFTWLLDAGWIRKPEGLDNREALEKLLGPESPIKHKLAKSPQRDMVIYRLDRHFFGTSDWLPYKEAIEAHLRS